MNALPRKSRVGQDVHVDTKMALRPSNTYEDSPGQETKIPQR
jgi:hypothetical protein